MSTKLTGLIIACILAIMYQMEVKGMNGKAVSETMLPARKHVYMNNGQKNPYVNNYFSENHEVFTSKDSLYISRLNSIPTEMGLKFNPAVRDYIEKYIKNGGKHLGALLGKGKYYFPLFEEVLYKEGVPIELKYLPVIESALNPTAHSGAGATGLWQFMRSTAETYGLEISNHVDERRDPVKSTYAAVRYLKDLYYIYQDWYLVIAAYNCGPANVNKAIYRSGGKTDYWAIYRYLPKETRNYVPAFIAAAYIMNYYNEHNIIPLSMDYAQATNSVKINVNVNLQHIANIIDISVDEIRKYNPQFKGDVIPGKDKVCSLNLPAQKVLAFIENEDAIYGTSFGISDKSSSGVSAFSSSVEAREATTYYKIRKGDNLYKIAKKNNVTVAELKKWNNIRKDNLLKAGSELKIQVIEYFVIEPRLKAPELLVMSVDTNTKDEIVDNYLNRIGVEIDIRKAMVQGKASSDMKLLSVVNNIDYKVTRYAVGKKNVFDRFVTFVNSTYRSVKGGNDDTRLNRIKPEDKPVELLAISTPPMPVKGIPIQIEIPVVEAKIDNYSLAINEISEKTKFYNTTLSEVDFRKIYHKVKIGETITKIASRYNVSKDDIIMWNNLTTGMAKISQQLLIYIPKKENNLPIFTTFASEY